MDAHHGTPTGGLRLLSQKAGSKCRASHVEERGVVLDVRVVSPLGSSSRSLPLVEHDITFGKLELLYGVS